jgi:molybdenum cofactor cytidylyltransferase
MPPLVVVPGSHAAEIRAALDDPDALIRHNPRWREAMGTCIHAGVETLNEFDVDGIVLALADQPKITPQILNRLLVTHWATGQPIVASQYADTVGVSCLLLACPEAEGDIDTPEDYARLAAPSSSLPQRVK